MYFTQEDYRKIENWLCKRSIKDNDLPIANSIKGNEKIPLLQDEENKISNIEDIAQYVGTTIIPDFYNITENNDDTSFKSLGEALSKVPRSHQKLGLVITYRNINDKWCIFQFTSKSLSAWYNAAYWEDILQNGKISKLNTTIGDVRSSFNNYASAKTPIIDKVEPHIANKQNPHEVTKAQVGLSNVTNDAQVKRSEMGANDGVATLDANGKVLESQLPAAVTYAANLPDNIVGGGKATAAENGIILSLDATNKENGNVSSKDILIPNVDGTKTSGSGLMLNSDKTKLDSIKAVNTTFMTAIDDFVSNKQGLQMNYYLRNLKNALDTGYKTIPLASTTTNGIMSATDKVKLDSLSNYTLPTADSSTLGGIKIGSGLNIDSNGTVSVDNLSSGGSSNITEYTEAEITALLKQIRF